MRDTPCDAAVQTRVHLTEWIPFTVPTLINVIYPVNILIWLKFCSSLLSVSLKIYYSTILLITCVAGLL